MQRYGAFHISSGNITPKVTESWLARLYSLARIMWMTLVNDILNLTWSAPKAVHFTPLIATINAKAFFLLKKSDYRPHFTLLIKPFSVLIIHYLQPACFIIQNNLAVPSTISHIFSQFSNAFVLILKSAETF